MAVLNKRKSEDTNDNTRLRPEDRISQTEDAYARATVALTRAQTILFGPLDMKGLPGAATVIGSLVYGVGHCWRSNIQMHWRHGDLQHSDADAAALDKRDCKPIPRRRARCPMEILCAPLMWVVWPVTFFTANSGGRPLTLLCPWSHE